MNSRQLIIDNFLNSIDMNHIDDFNYCLPQISRIKNKISSEIKGQCLKLAIENDNEKMVQSLVNEKIIGINNKFECISLAIGNENIDILKILISAYKLDEPFDANIIPDDHDSQEEYSDDVKTRVLPLLSVNQIKDIDKAKKIYELLIPICCPEKLDSIALFTAVRDNNKNAIDLLFDKSNVKRVINRLETIQSISGSGTLLSNDGVKYFYDKVREDKINKDKHQMMGAIKNSNKSKPIKKM